MNKEALINAAKKVIEHYEGENAVLNIKTSLDNFCSIYSRKSKSIYEFKYKDNKILMDIYTNCYSKEIEVCN